jgi:predicted PurR-regulated permease PerM
LLGVVYYFTKLPHPILFGMFTAVAAMIPFAAAIAVGLAALVLLGNGAFGAAIIVILAGLIVTFVADHFVRPKLIGGATKLPFLWVLLGILGGVESFQLLGLFLGPAIMAALMLLWRELTGAQNFGQFNQLWHLRRDERRQPRQKREARMLRSVRHRFLGRNRQE